MANSTGWKCPDPAHDTHGVFTRSGIIRCNTCLSLAIMIMSEDDTLDRIETLLTDMNARMERMEDWIRDMKGETK